VTAWRPSTAIEDCYYRGRNYLPDEDTTHPTKSGAKHRNRYAELPSEFSEVRGKLGLAPMGLTLGAECKRSDSLGGKTHHTPFYSPTIYKAGNLVDFPLWNKKLMFL